MGVEFDSHGTTPAVRRHTLRVTAASAANRSQGSPVQRISASSRSRIDRAELASAPEAGQGRADVRFRMDFQAPAGAAPSWPLTPARVQAARRTALERAVLPGGTPRAPVPREPARNTERRPAVTPPLAGADSTPAGNSDRGPAIAGSDRNGNRAPAHSTSAARRRSSAPAHSH